MKKERPIRSAVKSVSWRVLATITTIMLVWILSNNIKLAFSVGVIEILAKLIIYYLHERLWINIKWGVKKSKN